MNENVHNKNIHKQPTLFKGTVYILYRIYFINLCVIVEITRSDGEREREREVL